MNKSVSEMVIAVMVLVALAAFAMPASASGDPGAGCPVDTLYHGTINGSIYFEHKGALANSPAIQTFDVPDGIKLAKIYTGIWGGSPSKGGTFNITVDNGASTYTTMTYQSCDPCPTSQNCGCYPDDYQNDATRCDALRCVGVPSGTPPFNVPPNPVTLPDDIRGRISGCNVQFISFNATPYIAAGSNTITVKTCKDTSCAENCSGGGWTDARIYLIALLVVYEDDAMPEMTYWIDEGAAYMEKGSDCDGPGNHLTASYYFNGTGMVANPRNATYEVLGFPHVINAGVPGVSSTELNGNNIGAPDYIGYAGGNDVYARYDRVDGSYLHPTTNLMDYWDSAPYFERSYVAWIMVKGPETDADLVPDPEPEFPRMMRPDKDYTINATIMNRGSDPAGSFNIGLLVNDVPSSTVSVPAGLAGGANTTVSFDVNLPYGCYDFKVVADCDNQVDESNENNNVVVRDYQVGHYIVVDGNADFDALVTEAAAPGGLPTGSVVKTGDTYYIQNLDIENCPGWGEKHGYGILIENTDVPFVIANCVVHNCGVDGVRLRNLVDGKVNDCTVEDNLAKGIKLINCSYMEIDNNLAQNNYEYGIDVYMEAMPIVDCEFINITGNTLTGNKCGIELYGDNCIVRGNIIQNSADYGIYMTGNGSEVYNNTIENNYNYGLKLDNLSTTPCFDNYIYRNDIRGNGGVLSQAYDSGTTNTWNTGTPVAYSYGGMPYTNYTGNYWSDYGGSDPDGDGIGNTAYALDGETGAADSYPMILPWWGDTFDIPIYNGKNLIAIPLIQDDPTLAAVFGDDPVNNDRVYRYIGGAYKSAYCWDGSWYGAVSDVEPMEPEVGYEYHRKDIDYTLTIVGTRCTGTISTPIYNGKNLIGYVNFTETDLFTFNSPVNNDRVYRYIDGAYKSAYYWDGLWYGAVSDVEPIEAGVGYEYHRKAAQYNWIYEA